MSDGQTSLKVRFCPLQTTLAVAEMQLKDMVCNRSVLEQLLTVDGGETAMTDLQTQMCYLPADVLQETERLFLSQLDLTKFLTVSIGWWRNQREI